ncbi:KH domain-containing protein [Melia azedarach]|uniref:KH domain-containing protein n=1 Tax=Melia azedarach TaxID=155640 RepID=A0ACC1Y4Y5_MELAZ|nr:KH domain-containing protein [Melia azedarach]
MESGFTEFRLVCSAAIGKSESTIGHLESVSGAKIRVLDEHPCEECIIQLSVDSAASANRDNNHNVRKEEEETWTAEQKVLVRVYEAIMKVETGEQEEEEREVTCKMVIGRGICKVLEKIETESGANIRVLAKDHIHASSPDELIQITGRFTAVKKALLFVSSFVQDGRRGDAANTNVTKSSGMAVHGNHIPAVESFHQRGYAPGYHSRSYSSGPGYENVGGRSRMYYEEDVVFKLLCHLDKVGSLIGKGGSIVRTMQNETGASIKIADIVPDSDERIVVISARENSELKHSPAQDAVMRVHSRIAEIGFEPGQAVIARLLVQSQQIGCLLGRGGHIVSEMRRATGASIRVFPKDQGSRCGSPNDEVVQVIGNYHSVQDALFHITSRLRETIFPMKRPFPNSGPPYMSPFPDMPPPPFRPRHNPASPGSYPSPVGPFHSMDRCMGPAQPLDHQPAFSHGMDPMGPPNSDRVPYPYGSERPGHGPTFDRPPSPRSWTPQGVGSGTPRGIDVGPGFNSRNGPLGSGNHAPILTSTTVEVVIPQAYLAHVYGENNSNLGHIRQISGANIVVNDPKPGATEGVVTVSGTSDQMRAAQSLIHAFILCGVTS